MTVPVGKEVPQIASLFLSGILTFLILSHFSAGIAVYSVANSIVGAAERAIAVRMPKLRA